jgi:hypothetical protein
MKTIKPEWLKEAKKAIRKEVGPKCSVSVPFCYTCDVWRAYDTLEVTFERPKNEDTNA